VDAILIDAWMRGLDALPTVDEASASAAREAVRVAGATAGLEHTQVEAMAVAASELVHNQLRHGRRGRFAARSIARGGVPGIEIVAADRGLGIADPAAALAGPGPGAGSLGAGLSGARRMTHELDLDVRIGEGTCVRARLFAEQPPRAREVGIYGRALPHEATSGDHAAFVRDGDVLTLALADGIGHGPLAHDAAGRAIAAFQAQHGLSPTATLEACHHAVLGSRGAVMAVARIDAAARSVEHAAVGNIMTRIERWRKSRLFTGSSATLGARGPRRKPLAETVTIEPTEVLMMYTDGLTSRVSLADEPDLLREHPVVIAQRVLTLFGRANDDALVVVAR